MLGALIGAGVSLASSLFSGNKAAKERAKVEASIKKQLQENQDWYNRRYNEDSTQRADAQAAITKVQEDVKERNRAAAGTQAVMGGTEASTAATKAANNKAISDTLSNIVVAGEQRKDQIEQQYLQNKQNLNNQLNEYNLQSANNIAQQGNDTSNALLGLGSALADLF